MCDKYRCPETMGRVELDPIMRDHRTVRVGLEPSGRMKKSTSVAGDSLQIASLAHSFYGLAAPVARRGEVAGSFG